jgi:hypothetical protein
MGEETGEEEDALNGGAETAVADSELTGEIDKDNNDDDGGDDVALSSPPTHEEESNIIVVGHDAGP